MSKEDKIYGELKIVSIVKKNGKKYAECECSCGCAKLIRYDSILSGKTTSCGHLGKRNQFKKIDLTNKQNRFGVTAVESTTDKKRGSYVWKCRCACGNTFFCEAERFSKIKSCGCISAENAKTNCEEARKRYDIDNTRIPSIMHKKLLKNNTSGCTGVTFDKSRGKWVAQIVFKGRCYRLGRFERKEDAVKIRKIAEESLHGNFLKWFAKEFPERWEKINKNSND